MSKFQCSDEQPKKFKDNLFNACIFDSVTGQLILFSPKIQIPSLTDQM